MRRQFWLGLVVGLGTATGVSLLGPGLRWSSPSGVVTLLVKSCNPLALLAMTPVELPPFALPGAAPDSQVCVRADGAIDLPPEPVEVAEENPAAPAADTASGSNEVIVVPAPQPPETGATPTAEPPAPAVQAGATQVVSAEKASPPARPERAVEPPAVLRLPENGSPRAIEVSDRAGNVVIRLVGYDETDGSAGRLMPPCEDEADEAHAAMPRADEDDGGLDRFADFWRGLFDDVDVEVTLPWLERLQQPLRTTRVLHVTAKPTESTPVVAPAAPSESAPSESAPSEPIPTAGTANAEHHSASPSRPVKPKWKSRQSAGEDGAEESEPADVPEAETDGTHGPDGLDTTEFRPSDSKERPFGKQPF